MIYQILEQSKKKWLNHPLHPLHYSCIVLYCTACLHLPAILCDLMFSKSNFEDMGTDRMSVLHDVTDQKVESFRYSFIYKVFAALNLQMEQDSPFILLNISTS